MPKEHIALYEAVALENNIEKGRRIMSALMPFMGILEQSGKPHSNRKTCLSNGWSAYGASEKAAAGIKQGR